jgi:hypothetical protein
MVSQFVGGFSLGALVSVEGSYLDKPIYQSISQSKIKGTLHFFTIILLDQAGSFLHGLDCLFKLTIVVGQV